MGRGRQRAHLHKEGPLWKHVEDQESMGPANPPAGSGDPQLPVRRETTRFPLSRPDSPYPHPSYPPNCPAAREKERIPPLLASPTLSCP
eukprot:scaffold6357_cov119-Isochrysis_galbana.AAC.1